MIGFVKFKQELPNKKKKNYSPLTCKKISDKEYEHVLKVCNTFQMKKMKDYNLSSPAKVGIQYLI